MKFGRCRKPLRLEDCRASSESVLPQSKAAAPDRRVPQHKGVIEHFFRRADSQAHLGYVQGLVPEPQPNCISIQQLNELLTEGVSRYCKENRAHQEDSMGPSADFIVDSVQLELELEDDTGHPVRPTLRLVIDSYTDFVDGVFIVDGEAEDISSPDDTQQP